MLKQVLNAVRRQPIIAALLVVALALTIFLVARMATKESFKYNCEESWATCKSANPTHCYWGGSSWNKGLCCPKPWSGASGCSKPGSSFGSIRRVVTFHKDEDFKGGTYSYDVTEVPVGGKFDIPNFMAPDGGRGFNDEITSIRVPYGYKVKVFTDTGFTGSHTWIYNDSKNLGTGWNDTISSAQVYRDK